MSDPRGDAGSATAELALALPAVVAVLGLCLGGLGLGVVRLRAQDAAADAARIVARGEAAGRAAARVAAELPRATVTFHDEGDLVCATVAAQGLSALPGIVVTASSCALGGGR